MNKLIDTVEEIKEKYQIQDSEYLSLMSSLKEISEQIGYDPNIYTIKVLYNKISTENYNDNDCDCSDEDEEPRIRTHLNVNLSEYEFTSRLEKCKCRFCDYNPNLHHCKPSKCENTDFFSGKLVEMNIWKLFGMVYNKEIKQFIEVDENPKQIIYEKRISEVYCYSHTAYVQIRKGTN